MWTVDVIVKGASVVEFGNNLKVVAEAENNIKVIHNTSVRHG